MKQNIPQINSICMRCVAKDRVNQFPEDASEQDKVTYINAVFKELAKMENQHGPTIATRNIYDLQKKMFGYHKSYLELRTKFNSILMEQEAEIRKSIQESEDPLKAAVQYAIAGNYIDFMVMKNVDVVTLKKLLQEAPNYVIDREALEMLRVDIQKAQRLVYLTDNCGEIVIDKLVMEQLLIMNPKLQITAIVRGEEILNDATMEDAVQIGLSDVAHVIGNGDSLPGTCLYRISDEAKCAINHADVVISKGQGNLEMLQGCNFNLYHIFLCKCEMISEMFKVPKFTPMLVKEECDFIHVDL